MSSVRSIFGGAGSPNHRSAPVSAGPKGRNSTDPECRTLFKSDAIDMLQPQQASNIYNRRGRLRRWRGGGLDWIELRLGLNTKLGLG